MTGIERLRRLAGSQDMGNAWTAMLANELTDIADQIEREQDKVAMTDWEAVRDVCDDMARHVSGIPEFDDLVDEWVRKLDDALDGRERRDPAADVSVSAYDLPPQEDREAIAWVREHGGIERVKAQRRESMPRAAYERKKAGFLDHIAECERALGRRRETISELNRRASDLTRENAELRKRAMPDGMEWLLEAWPRFEDGRPVRFSDDFERYGDENGVSVVTMYVDGSFALNCRAYSKGERVNRPAPKVLDADGEPCEVGDAVWWTRNLAGSFRIIRIEQDGKCAIRDDDPDEPCGMTVPSTELTHKRPVLDADGVEIRVGDTVYRVGMSTFDPEYNTLTVTDIRTKPGLTPIETKNSHDGYNYGNPEDFTHRAPVLAADGKPLREGETVWDTNGDELVIGALEDGGHTVTCRYVDVGGGIPVHGMWSPSNLTHQRPDSWERLEEDCAKSDVDYCAERGLLDPSCDTVEGDGSTRHCTDCGCTCGEKMARDLVRRAKKLAEVSE